MLDHETNHLQRLLELLPLQYQNLSNWETLMVRFWAPEIQRLEDVADALLPQFQLTAATGTWLELWGKILQFPKPTGMDDTRYRRLLNARAAGIRSIGTIADLARVGTAAFASSGSVLHIIETPPASVVLQVEQELFVPMRTVAEILAGAVSAGIRPMVVFSQVYPGDPEGFDVPTIDPNTALDDRRAGVYTPRIVTWFLDDVIAGVYRLESFGDTLL